MRLGVNGLSALSDPGPGPTLRLARLAEQLGYTSWWVGDHVVLPSPRTPESSMDPTDPILDPLVHLAYVAAITDRLEIGTGIIILPQRNPPVLAKQVASLDVLSGGRLMLGVAAGYSEPEMTAVGVPFSERGARVDEYLDAMISLWRDPAPNYAGRYVSFGGVDAHPRPVRKSGPRIVVGGHTPAAYRRAVAKAHGWYGNGSSPDDLAQNLAGLKRAAAEVERPAHLGRLEINFLPLAEAVDVDSARRYEDLGVDRLVLFPALAQRLAGAPLYRIVAGRRPSALPVPDADQVAVFLERHAEALAPVAAMPLE